MSKIQFCKDCIYAMWSKEVVGKNIPIRCLRSPLEDAYAFYLVDPHNAKFYMYCLDNRKEGAKCGPQGNLFKKRKWWELKN